MKPFTCALDSSKASKAVSVQFLFLMAHTASVKKSKLMRMRSYMSMTYSITPNGSGEYDYPPQAGQSVRSADPRSIVSAWACVVTLSGLGHND